MSKIWNEEFKLCLVDSSGMFEVIAVFYDVDIARQVGRILSSFYKRNLFIVHYIDGSAVCSMGFPLRIEWF